MDSNINTSEITEKKVNKNGYNNVLCIAAIVLLTVASTVFVMPFADVLGILAVAGFVSVYSALYVNADVKYRVLPIIIPAILVATMAYIDSAHNLDLFLKYVNLIFIVVIAVGFGMCAENKTSKTVTFVFSSVAVSLYLLTVLLCIVALIYKQLDFKTVAKAITDLSDFVGKTLNEAYLAALSTMPEANSKEVMDTVYNLVETVKTGIKMSLPSAIATFGIVISAIIVALYKPFLNVVKAKDICLNERNWIFTLSKVSAVFFEIVFVVYTFTLIFGGNMTLAVAMLNLFTVLSLPFGYIGLKSVYSLLKSKLNSKLVPVIILVCSFFFFALLIGSDSFITIAAIIGASSIVKSSIDQTPNK